MAIRASSFFVAVARCTEIRMMLFQCLVNSLEIGEKRHILDYHHLSKFYGAYAGTKLGLWKTLEKFHSFALVQRSR